jgi:molybdenum cofactor biosynthesis protein B
VLAFQPMITGSIPEPSAEQHRRVAPSDLGFAVLTVSDTRAERDDASGNAIREMISGAGHRLVDSTLVRDDVAAIRDAVRRLLALDGVDVVVTTGGTGFSPRDVTLDAVGPLLDQRIDGFGELFRMLSYNQVGAAAMLSRAAAGLVGTRAVFLLPGSPKAVRLAMEALILPEAAHLLGQARRAFSGGSTDEERPPRA